VSVTTETLMEALDRSLEGVQVERGGALHAKPDDNVRRRIQVFKRLEAERDYEGHGFGDIEDDLIAESAAEVDREATLKRLLQLAAKTVQIQRGRRVSRRGARRGRRSWCLPRLRTSWTSIGQNCR